MCIRKKGSYNSNHIKNAMYSVLVYLVHVDNYSKWAA